MRPPVKYSSLAGQRVRSKRQASRSSSWSGSRSLKRHFLSRAVHDVRFLSREEHLYLSVTPLFIYPYALHSICTCIYIYIYLSFSFSYCFSNYKLYWQLTTSLRLVRSFHGKSDDISVANGDILVDVCVRRNLSMEFSDAVRFEDTWFFRGSTTAMVVRALKCATSYRRCSGVTLRADRRAPRLGVCLQQGIPEKMEMYDCVLKIATGLRSAGSLRMWVTAHHLWN